MRWAKSRTFCPIWSSKSRRAKLTEMEHRQHLMKLELAQIVLPMPFRSIGPLHTFQQTFTRCNKKHAGKMPFKSVRPLHTFQQTFTLCSKNALIRTTPGQLTL